MTLEIWVRPSFGVRKNLPWIRYLVPTLVFESTGDFIKLNVWQASVLTLQNFEFFPHR
jgi:hypothetical protein